MTRHNYIVIHCTATPHNTKLQSIVNYWRNVLGWKNNGYHFIIDKNGNCSKITPIDKIANGVKNKNANSIHIAYIGGIDNTGHSVDNRTLKQKESLLYYLRDLKSKFPKAKILGHRDFPEVKKDCPCFNAAKEYENIFDIFG